MDFSFSDDGAGNENEKEDWEIEADKTAAKAYPQAQQGAQTQFQEEQLDEQIKANQQQLRRDEQNQKIVYRFLETAESESQGEETAQHQRDYTAENEFMAGEVIKTQKDFFDRKLDTYEAYEQFGALAGEKIAAFYRKGEELQYLNMMKKMVDAVFADLPAEHLAALGKFCYDKANEAIRGKTANKGKKANKKPYINTYGGKAGKIDDDMEDFM